MEAYNLKKIENCFVCGNIDKNINKFIQDVLSNLSKYEAPKHPKEIEKEKRLRDSEDNSQLINNHPWRMRAASIMANKKTHKGMYNNSLIVVSGNCGIGCKSLEYYNNLFSNIEKILSDNNCFIFFIRGNNDDPSIFNECKINFEHIKTIPDYSVVCLKYYSCLCIGGSISVDKEWKLFQENEFGKKMFWEDEAPIFDEEKLDKIVKDNSINCVITSTSPSFAFPGTNRINNSKWVKNNKEIKTIFSNERKTLDKIYEKITDANVKPYLWIYGRFKISNKAKVNDIVFDSLAPFQVENINELLTTFFRVNLGKKLGDNTFTLDEICEGNDEPYVINAPRMHDLEYVEEDDVDVDDFEMAHINYNGTTIQANTNVVEQITQEMPQLELNPVRDGVRGQWFAQANTIINEAHF